MGERIIGGEDGIVEGILEGRLREDGCGREEEVAGVDELEVLPTEE